MDPLPLKHKLQIGFFINTLHIFKILKDEHGNQNTLWMQVATYST